MTATVQMDQDGLPSGVPGRSRTDGKRDGSLVTVTNVSKFCRTTKVEIVWAPPDDLTAVSSLTRVSGNAWTFTPTPGVWGSYLIEMTEDAGLQTERVERRVFGVRSPVLGLLIPAPTERFSPDAEITTSAISRLTDEADDNSTDYQDPDLDRVPFAGDWRKLYELFAAVEALAAAPSPAGASLGTLQFGASGVSNSTTPRYLVPGNTDGTAPSSVQEVFVPEAITLTGLTVAVSKPGTSTAPVVYTVRVNDVDTALAVSLPSNGVGAFILGPVAVPTGARISVRVTKAATISQPPSLIAAVLTYKKG